MGGGENNLTPTLKASPLLTKERELKGEVNKKKPSSRHCRNRAARFGLKMVTAGYEMILIGLRRKTLS